MPFEMGASEVRLDTTDVHLRTRSSAGDGKPVLAAGQLTASPTLRSGNGLSTASRRGLALLLLRTRSTISNTHPRQAATPASRHGYDQGRR